MSEEKKQRLKEYQKNIAGQKSLNITMNKIILIVIDKLTYKNELLLV